MTSPLPTLFLSHGSPMHAMSPGAAGARLARARARVAAAARDPHGVGALGNLAADAHGQRAVPQTIHDFGGFPQELYAIGYAAPGRARRRGARGRAAASDAGIAAGIDGCRGLDHGAWVPLLHMYPEHDVPVVQLSLQPRRGTAHHVALGRALAPLASEGVLIVGSGTPRTTCATGSTNRRRHGAAALRRRLHAVVVRRRWRRSDIEALVDYRERAPDAARAHPTEEHFLPLLVAWGAAGRAPRVEHVVKGSRASALAMDSWLFQLPSARRFSSSCMKRSFSPAISTMSPVCRATRLLADRLAVHARRIRRPRRASRSSRADAA